MSNFVPAVTPMSTAKIEIEASSYIRRHYPMLLVRPGAFPVLDFFDILRDDYGLDPAVESLSDGVEGVTWPDGRVTVSEQTYRGAQEGKGRARFTVAHECYHGLKHRDQIRSALVHAGQLVLHRRETVPAFRDPEWQANVFASALLMPADMVRMLADQVHLMSLTSQMIDVFQVSNSAAEVRRRKLGL